MVGGLPPPLGGVTVFVYRYSRLLRQQGYEVVHLLDRPIPCWRWLGPLWRLLFLGPMWRLFWGSSKAMYYVNDYNPYVALALLLRPWRTHIVFHYHAGEMLERYQGWKKWLLKRLLDRTTELVLVRDIRDHFLAHGYRLPANTQFRYAFLPPPPEDEPAIWKTYTPEIRAFVKEHRPCLIANVYQIDYYRGVDMYGLDMLVESLPALVYSYPQAGLIGRFGRNREGRIL